MGTVGSARIGAVAAVAAACTVGCGDARGVDAVADPLVRDSAGIRIVENPGGGAPPRAPDEVVRIGAVEGAEAYTFNRIVDLEVTATAVYVLDGGDNVVRQYDHTGKHVRTFGGSGEGPGEFQRAAQLGRVGDTLVVFDYSLQKLERFTAEGESLGADRVSLPLSVYGFPTSLEPVPGGFIAAMVTGCSLPRPEDLRPLWRLLLLAPDLTVRDTLAVVHDRAQLAMYGERFCSAAFAPASPTHALGVGAGGVVAYTDGGRYEILVFRASVPAPPAPAASIAAPTAALDPRDVWAVPAPHLVIRLQADARPFTPADADAYWAPYVGDTASDHERERVDAMRAALDTLGMPTHWPTHTDLVYDDAGGLWAGRPARVDGTERIWDRFDEGGARLEQVALPAGFDLRAVRGGIAWGTETDELDVMYVSAYRIEP